LDTEGKLELEYLVPEALLSVSICSDDDTDFTESDSKYDSELDPDVDMCMEDNVDALDGVGLDGDVDMKTDGDHEAEEDAGEDDENKEDEEEEEEEVDEDEEEEDKDEDDGKEPQTIGETEMVNTSAEQVDTMVDDEPIVLPEQGQEMCKHAPQPEPPAPAPRQQTSEPRSQPPTPEPHHISRLQHLGIVTPQKPRPAVPTRLAAEAARNTSDVDVDVDVDQHLLIELAGGDSLPDVPLPDVPLSEVPLPDNPLPDVPLSDVPLPDIPLPDVPLAEAHPDSLVGGE
jgi:hypothetical protein